jgi:CubicO group peptidase (beta-lactamase class C family)
MRALIAAVFVTASAHAQWPAELDAWIEKARTQWEVPGVGVTVVQDGKVLVAKGYGVRRHGAPELVDAHTMFDTASMSKSFTAAAIATLVDEGKMRWDDPVRRHLPAFELRDPYRTQNVTIRDLLAHRVGLERGDYMFVFGNYTTAELIRRMRYLDEIQPFRATMTYHNISYSAAAEAAASAAGMPFPELLRTHLIEPLGMTESTIAINHDVGVSNYSDGHSVSDGVLRPIRARKALNVLGANAVNATPHDMAKWLLFQLGDGTWEGKRIISEAAMEEMHSPQIIITTTPQMRAARNVHFFAGYGLGWQVMDYRGHRMLWHSGGADGMPTYMAILPARKIGVCVMVNTWHAPILHGTIAGRILDHLLGVAEKKDPPAPPASAARTLPKRIEGTKPSRPLDEYAGTYVDELYGDMVVTLAEGKMTLQFAGGELADVEHWHHDVFRVKWRDRAYDWADAMAAFALDPEGKPRSFRMTVGRTLIDAARP